MRSLTLKHSNWLMGWGRGDLSTARGLLAAAAADAGRGEREECSTLVNNGSGVNPRSKELLQQARV